MEDKPKVDKNKMDQAVGVLKEIMATVEKYDLLFKTFTPQEKHLAGGIIFRIRNIWNDFSMVGVMADREIAREMLDTLIVFFQHPEQFKGKQDPSIETATSKIKDDLSN